MDERATLLALAALAHDAAHRVPSPCVSVCRMHPDSGLCVGCLRSIDEIVAWGRLGEADKRRVWRDIEQRAAQHAV